MLVCEFIADLRSRIEVVGSWEGSVMSRGGLRRDFSVTVRECSAPGASFCFFAKGLGILWRMYWYSQLVYLRVDGVQTHTALCAG